MKLAFILLAYKEPSLLRPLIESLLSSGADIYVHYDKNAPYDLEHACREWKLDEKKGNIFFAERIHVAWGEWSIVQATLNCLELANSHIEKYTYFTLISGSCMPIKPVEMLEDFLLKSGQDHIETVNTMQHRWVIDGIQNERWEQYHFFNARYHPNLFKLAFKLQKRLKIKREIPHALTPYIGSQWWSLRSSTISKILSFISNHKEVLSFYQHTWIPDESFFQTLVGNLVAEEERTKDLILTYKFNHSGAPHIYYADHYNELMLESNFIVRKVSHTSSSLKDKLAKIGAMSKMEYMDFRNREIKQWKIKNMNEVQDIADYYQNRWNTIAQSSDKYHIIRSFPCEITILCAMHPISKKHIQEIIASVKCNENTLVFGDLFNKHEIDFGKDLDSYAGFKKEDHAIASYKWHFFLKDLINFSKCSKLIFTLGEEAPQYLETLRWSKKITVIKVDELELVSEMEDITKDELRALVAYHTSISNLMGDRHCEYHALSLSQIPSRFQEDICTR